MNPTNRPTRSEQREEARSKAKALREQTKKNERRRGVLVKGGIALGIVGVFAIIAAVVIGGMNNSSSGKATLPGNLTAEFGVKLGVDGQAYTATNVPTPVPSASASAPAKAPVEIVTYVDYQCPYCKLFENANLTQIQGWLNTGVATLEVRPLSFLDGRDTPNEYSSRAAAVALAVATYDPNSFFAVNEYLFKNQPESGTYGPDNSTLLRKIGELGVKNVDLITTAVNDGRYKKWVLSNTTATFKVNAPLAATGTPFVTVNGKQYSGALDNAAQFAQFVTSQAGN
ncbi:MAG: DsbA family protein [Micrococcales bacterium]